MKGKQNDTLRHDIIHEYIISKKMASEENRSGYGNFKNAFFAGK